MGETTAIEWCHHTLNPWIGCAKVSEACKHCYAEVSTPARVMRSKGEETWGVGSVRHETKDWEADIRRWNRAALAVGERRRVFCASLADVFENHASLPSLRARLFAAQLAATGLDHLLLTKRPENVPSMVPAAWLEPGGWPAHVWIGTTVESQEWAEKRIPRLLAVPATVRFLSVEPMLGPIDLRWALNRDRMHSCSRGGEAHNGSDMCAACHSGDPGVETVTWVICGGESGPHARPMHPVWARDIRDQCASAGVPFLFKQWGDWVPRDLSYANLTDDPRHATIRLTEAGKDGSRLENGDEGEDVWMEKVGKKAAGRLLDGVQHDGYPETRS